MDVHLNSTIFWDAYLEKVCFRCITLGLKYVKCLSMQCLSQSIVNYRWELTKLLLHISRNLILVSRRLGVSRHIPGFTNM